ncbi:unnamed protein product, partial [Meganyctiphanes norvegica]
MNVNCGICDAIVEEDSEGLYCDVCKCWYHNVCGESPLIEDIYCLLNDAPINVKWFCDKCIWETEKWITSLNADKSNDIIRDETIPKVQEAKFKNIEPHNETHVNLDISSRENNKIKKKGRTKKEKVKKGRNTVCDSNSDHPELTEVKIELHDEAIDFEDRQNSDADSCIPDDTEVGEEYENSKEKQRSTILKKKRYCARKHKCDLCTKSFRYHENLVAHKLWHDGDKKPYKCTECGKTFMTSSGFKIHSTKHSDNKPFTCEICAKSFVLKWLLKTHMITHSSEKPYVCEICGKAFLQKGNLKSHMYCHKAEKSFACTMCSVKCARKHTLQLHMKRDHDGLDAEQKYACTLCDFKTSKKGNLIKRHMRTHSNKSCVCDICGKKLVNSKSLEDHITLHTGEKPHICEICGKQFRAKTGLRIHMNKYHINKKNFHCPHCGYNAHFRYELKRHVDLVHTNETPYECDMCGNKYKTKGNLSKHKRGIRGSCPGANVGNTSKPQKHAIHSRQNEAKLELAQASDQERAKYRFQFKPLPEEVPDYLNNQPLLVYTGAPSSILNSGEELISSSSITLQVSQ